MKRFYAIFSCFTKGISVRAISEVKTLEQVRAGVMRNPQAKSCAWWCRRANVSAL